MDYKNFDFENGITLLIDKELGKTSFQAVKSIRHGVKKITKKRKNKVGHAGTLDPLATGLLIICIGKDTKKISSFQNLNKTYTGSIKIGATTPSFDLETEIDATFPTNHITEDIIQKIAKSMEGTQEQMPPIFSAKKINGERAYNLARNNQTVNLKKSIVSIYRFEITNINLETKEVDFEIECSKGTYIRSIAHDFGKNLNSGAHLISLRRTKIGNYKVDDAITVNDFNLHIDKILKNIE